MAKKLTGSSGTTKKQKAPKVQAKKNLQPKPKKPVSKQAKPAKVTKPVKGDETKKPSGVLVNSSVEGVFPMDGLSFEAQSRLLSPFSFGITQLMKTGKK